MPRKRAMIHHDPASDHARHEAPPPPPRRTVGTWLLLLVVWSIGLLSWALYALAAIYLLSKVM